MANGDKVVVNMPTSYPLLLPLVLHRKSDLGFMEGLKGEKKVSTGGKCTFKKNISM